MSFSPSKRSWFSRFNPFARHPQQTASRRRAAVRPSVRPSLEALEDRFVPTVNFYGGPIIPNVEVNTLFLGQEWEPSSPNSVNGVQNGLNSYLQALVNSPYMDMLAQYNVGRGSFGSTATGWYSSDPNMQQMMDDNDTSYSGGLTELQSTIVSAIQQGWFAAPNSDQLYVVFLPPGEQVEAPGGLMNNAPNGFFGYHNSFNTSQYGTIYYAVLPFPGGQNPVANGVPTAFDSLTETVSHELSEAVTDPIPPLSGVPVPGVTGWFDPQHDEIGDIVNQQSVYWNGYVVQQEANQQDQGMVPGLPAAGATVTATANQSFNGTVMTFTDQSTTVLGDTATQSLGGSPLPGSSFMVTINWGDGQTSDGQVVYNGDGQYSVIGLHSYAQAGSYQISVSATDPYGVTASADSMVTVAPGQPVPPPPTNNPPPTYNPPTYNPPTYNPPTYNPPTYNPPTYTPPNNPPNNPPPNNYPPPPPPYVPPPPPLPPWQPSPTQLYQDGITLANDLFGPGGIDAILADAALMQDIEAAPGGLFNQYLDAGFFAEMSKL